MRSAESLALGEEHIFRGPSQQVVELMQSRMWLSWSLFPMQERSVLPALVSLPSVVPKLIPVSVSVQNQELGSQPWPYEGEGVRVRG